jgi:hypothetical protein
MPMALPERPLESWRNQLTRPSKAATSGVIFAAMRSLPAWVRPPDRGAPKSLL